MTDEQKILIKEMYIDKQISIRKISETLHIKRESINEYLSKNNLKMSEYNRKCINCGKEYVAKRPDSRFCCKKCRVDYINHNPKRPDSGIRICENCGKEYEYDSNIKFYTKDNLKAHVRSDKYCCFECGQMHHNKKVKQTNLIKYGTECSLHNEEVHKKTLKSWMEKYGCDNPLKNKELREQIRKTVNEKYSNGVVFHKNNKSYISKFEQEVCNFISSLNIDYSKLILGKGDSRFEIDIYIPDLHIGIECNGCYWHSISERKQGRILKDYHFKKSTIAKEKGIDLIHVWEDQWIHQKDIIQDILKARLNKVSTDNKIYARQCCIKAITNEDYKNFCLNNHIQGYRPAKIRYGLYYNDKLVQISSFNECQIYGKRKKQAQYEWIRGCIASNNYVIGGTSKLLKHFINEYNPDSILCYADWNLFNGRGYKKAGFKFVGYTGPDKFYIENSTLKRRARNPFKYKEYKQLVEDSKLFECYGAGSMKFIWERV